MESPKDIRFIFELALIKKNALLKRAFLVYGTLNFPEFDKVRFIKPIGEIP